MSAYNVASFRSSRACALAVRWTRWTPLRRTN